MRVLALDISGSGTGWAYGEDHELVKWGKHISNVKHSRGQRLYDFAQWLETLFVNHQPDVLLIEKPFLGRNSNVLANLSKFVAMAEYSAYSALDLALENDWFIDPRTIKKLLRVKKPSGRKNTKAKHDCNKKIMVDRINELYGLRLKYSQNRNKKYNDDDIADAIALLHAWWLIESKEEE